jgi:predicted alpha/beta hydrolase family esterase
MRTSDADILIVPGLGGSGPDHWQSRWAARLPTARLVAQADFDRPDLAAWRERLVEDIARAERPVILVAHSLGVLAVAHAAPLLRDRGVRGAFLVAPPAPETLAALPSVDPAFVAPPLEPLPFPSLIVASRDDPYAPYAESERLARTLGAELADAGNSGHIDADSGHGPWPEGLMRFAGFLKGL